MKPIISTERKFHAYVGWLKKFAGLSLLKQLWLKCWKRKDRKWNQINYQWIRTRAGAIPLHAQTWWWNAFEFFFFWYKKCFWVLKIQKPTLYICFYNNRYIHCLFSHHWSICALYFRSYWLLMFSHLGDFCYGRE